MNLLRALTVFVCIFIVACGGSKTTPDSTTDEKKHAMHHPESNVSAESSPKKSHQNVEKMCPMHLDGTTMAMEMPDGVMAMVFTNSSDASAVQERVRMMIAHHEKKMSAGMHTNADMPHFSLSAENTEDGAKLIMTPKDPSDLEKMRTMMKARHDAQGEKKCPMMMMMKSNDG